MLLLEDRGQLFQAICCNARHLSNPVFVPHQVCDFGIEHLPGGFAGLGQNLAAVLGIGVVTKISTLVEEPLSLFIDYQGKRIGVFLEHVSNREITKLRRVHVPGDRVAP